MTTYNLTPAQRILLFLSLSLATFMMVLDYSIANVSIPYIAGDLAVSDDEGTYVITSFATGNAVGLAMTGWLTKRVGEVKLFTISIALFTFFSWICGLSTSLGMLIIARVIQGVVAGPMIPLSQSLLIQTGTPQTRTRDLSIWSTIVIAAPVVGPVLGGYISDWYVWPWIFYINIPVGIFCVITTWAILHHYEAKTIPEPGDYLGIILLSLGVGCLQVLLDKGQQWDWIRSERIRILGITTIVSFTFLIIREIWHRKPLLDLTLFKIPSFTLSIVCLMISYAIYFGTVVIVPLWLQEYMGYNAEWAGTAVAALGIAPVCLSMITPKLMEKLGNVRTVAIAFSVFAIGCFYSTTFTTLVDVQHVAFARFVFGFGFICYVAPLINMSVQMLPPEKLASGAGIFHFLRAMMGAVGTSVFTTIWIRRTIFHHERISGCLTPFNPSTPVITTQADRLNLNGMLDQQAALLAINDCFFLMGWLFVILVALLIGWYLVRGRRMPPVQAHSVHAAAD